MPLIMTSPNPLIYWLANSTDVYKTGIKVRRYATKQITDWMLTSITSSVAL